MYQRILDTTSEKSIKFILEIVDAVPTGQTLRARGIEIIGTPIPI